MKAILKRRFVGLFLVVGLFLSPLAACGDPRPFTCPPGQVVERDDDGLECEPDANGDGLDDEGTEEEEGGIFGGKKKKPPTTTKKASSSKGSTSKGSSSGSKGKGK